MTRVGGIQRQAVSIVYWSTAIPIATGITLRFRLANTCLVTDEQSRTGCNSSIYGSVTMAHGHIGRFGSGGETLWRDFELGAF